MLYRFNRYNKIYIFKVPVFLDNNTGYEHCSWSLSHMLYLYRVTPKKATIMFVIFSRKDWWNQNLYHGIKE